MVLISLAYQSGRRVPVLYVVMLLIVVGALVSVSSLHRPLFLRPPSLKSPAVNISLAIQANLKQISWHYTVVWVTAYRGIPTLTCTVLSKTASAYLGLLT